MIVDAKVSKLAWLFLCLWLLGCRDVFRYIATEMRFETYLRIYF